jgi:predicted phage gp36 major capsid-like protein
MCVLLDPAAPQQTEADAFSISKHGCGGFYVIKWLLQLAWEILVAAAAIDNLCGENYSDASGV